VGSFVGVFLVVSEKKGVGKVGEKSLLLPLFSARPREEEDIWCRSKQHRFCFFFLKMYETTLFFAKRTVFCKTRRFI
jgi:hypothetical protein